MVSLFVLVDGFALPIVGWLIGVLLLARSQAWTPRGKFPGATVWPFLLLPGAVLLLRSRQSTQWCHGPSAGQESQFQCGDEILYLERPLV